MNWFQRHLNWTSVLAYLLWFVLNAGESVMARLFALVAAIFWLIVSGWVIIQKGRSFWWILLSWVGSPLWLKNQSQFQTSTIVRQSKEIKMGLLSKAKTGTGRLVQIVGGLLFIGSGLVVFIWELNALFTAFGAWTILVALLFAPITYFAAIFIVWFSTGIFPIIVLVLWLVSWLGAGIFYLGGRITGEG